jgi:dTDP-4-amino-4,6-dideoxygalactose transaminase
MKPTSPKKIRIPLALPNSTVEPFVRLRIVKTAFLLLTFQKMCIQRTKMKVPFLNLTMQYQGIKDEIAIALLDVLEASVFAGGPLVTRFEKAFGPYCQAMHAIGCGSGTEALWMALIGLGVGPGDAVVTVPNTFTATAEAISMCGATPVFVDCDAFCNMDVVKLRRLLRAKGREHRADGRGQGAVDIGLKAEGGERIKAIIPVHLYGQPADMDLILEVAQEYGLAVVEDACQAHGAIYKGKRVGAMGDAGCFSFYPGKNLGAYGEAGAVVTNRPELAQKMKMFRDHGQADKYYHDMVGWNARMDGFQAAVLNVKMKYIEEWTRKRQQHAALYTEILSEIDGIDTPKVAEGVDSVFHLYVIQTDQRDALQKYLKDYGIDTGLHYPTPLHLQAAYRHLGYRVGDFPAAERAAGRILSLPMFAELSKEEIRYVCAKIKEFVDRA